MRKLLLAAVALAALAGSANAAPLPNHFTGLWCAGEGDNVVMSYLPATETPCSMKDRNWVVIKPDGSYYGNRGECKAVRVKLIFRGDKIGRSSGANAIYDVEAHCSSGRQTWKETSRLEVERWGSAMSITYKWPEGE
jgi:hypothetical protein